MRCGRGCEELAIAARRRSAACGSLCCAAQGDHFCAGADITELNISRAVRASASFAAVVAAAEAALGRRTEADRRVHLRRLHRWRMLTSPSTATFASPPATPGSGSPPPNSASCIRAAALERAVHLLGPAVTKRLLFTGELISRRRGAARRPGRRDRRCRRWRGAACYVDRRAGGPLVVDPGGDEVDGRRRSWRTVTFRKPCRITGATSPPSAPDGAEGVAAFVEKRAARFTWSGPDGD